MVAGALRFLLMIEADATSSSMRLGLGVVLLSIGCSHAADPDGTVAGAGDEETTFVGRLDEHTLVALQSRDETAVLYICSGTQAEWLKGSARRDSARVASSTHTVELRYVGSVATGVLHEADGRERAFELRRVTDVAGSGLYAEEGTYGRTGVIVVEERGDSAIVGSYFVGPGIARQVTPIRPVDARGLLGVRLGSELRELPRFRIAAQ